MNGEINKELLDTLKLVDLFISDHGVYHAVVNYPEKPQVTLGMRIRAAIEGAGQVKTPDVTQSK